MNRLTFEQSVKALSKPPQKRVEGKHEKLINEVKARRTKKDKGPQGSVEVRQNLLETQNRTNYIMEYDRLKGVMKTGTVGAQQSQNLTKRQQELKDLVKLSVGGKLTAKQRGKYSALSQPHEIYNK